MTHRAIDPTFLRRATVLALGLISMLALGVGHAEAQVDGARGNRWSPRLRAGISGVGGGFVGHVHGGLGGIEPRIGIQINDWAAVLVQGQGLIGAFDADADSIAGFALHSAMFEVTLGSMFQVAAGPSLDFVWGCSEARGQVACARDTAYLGANFRAAVLFGGRHDAGWRDAFTLSVDAHPTLLDDGEWSTVLLLGLGVDLY